MRAPSEENPFQRFVESGLAYYDRVFRDIQHDRLPRWHVNWAALAGGFVWAALRGNWLLFWIGLAGDMIALVNAAQIYKYNTAAAQAVIDGKDFLVARYESWALTHLVAAILAIVAGRALFGWLADRLYYRQYEAWRVNQTLPSGTQVKRIALAGLIVLFIAPLTIYRATQFAPDEAACIKLMRDQEAGTPVALKARFDCWMISDFPTLFQLQRPTQYDYPRLEDGTRAMVVRVPTSDRPVSLSTYVAEAIDQTIAYLKVYYGWVFDTITAWLRSLLNAIDAVFVGTPWIVTAGLFLLIAWKCAGPRVAVFVGASLAYIALLGFWQTAMSTIAIVAASTIICVLLGLPLGVWIGKSKRSEAVVTPVLDIMQTIPSFVYLLPAVAFFSVGKPPGILATVIFSMPPMVRLTALGIRQVPESTKEAALAFGASPRQLLTKVELPLALPSIMAGVNQVVMMSLSMAVVAGLIGAGGLGYVVVEALANTQTGRGIVAGIAIALIAMMIDRVVQRATSGGK